MRCDVKSGYNVNFSREKVPTGGDTIATAVFPLWEVSATDSAVWVNRRRAFRPNVRSTIHIARHLFFFPCRGPAGPTGYLHVCPRCVAADALSGPSLHDSSPARDSRSIHLDLTGGESRHHRSVAVPPRAGTT
jgi:hypothetical protein